MATTGSLFSQTLQDITTAKLDELAKKRQLFEDKKKAVLTKVQGERDAVQRLALLGEGVKTCFAISVSGGRVVLGSTNNSRLEIDLSNLDRFLRQARCDPSLSANLLEQWHQSLLRHLNIQSLKFSFASLYGHLTTEWLQAKQGAPSIAAPGAEDVDMEDFEHVSGAKRMEARLAWEQSVFEPAVVDDAAVSKLLKEIFNTASENSKPLAKALEALQEGLRTFETSLASPGNFTFYTLQWTIKSLQASDLLTDEKRQVLKDFQGNPVIINEIADVLNMRMSAIDSWSWGDEVPVEQRRQLNGSFNVYMHEDLLQAIFLHYIGIKWSVYWKRAFTSLYRAKDVWKSSSAVIPWLDRKRREFYLQTPQRMPWHSSLQAKRQKLYRRSYFLSQLMSSETQQIVNEDGAEEANFDFDGAPAPAANVSLAKPITMARKQFSAKRMRRMAPPSDSSPVEEEDNDDDDDSGGDITFKNPMEAKQSLLHLLSTEILIKTRLHGEITCFRSQFESLYPTLPQSTILAVLQFFGVSKRWLNFFERFLQAPLRFMDDDTAARQRKRGTPKSHALSEVFGEVVLFCLDYNVNQAAEGEPLWRLHDDFWFWSSDYNRCVKVWTTITSFSRIMGLSLNKGRTGSARMLLKRQGEACTIVAADVKQPLPHGLIRWGMLYLNPASGRFEIDQSMVDKNIDELSRQLEDKTSSVFAWIQAWNTFATTFFTSNFGKPANCFGSGHVDSMLAAHERIQRKIFTAMDSSETGDCGSVVAYLKKTIEERFGVKDIPDGYFYFPTELGGLEVQNSFIRLLQIRDVVSQSPEKLLDTFEQAERDAYKAKMVDYITARTRNAGQYESRADNFQPADPSAFMPFDEYVKYREELLYGYSNELVDVFDELLKQPDEESIATDGNGQITIALQALTSQQANLKGILPSWFSMEPYWKWVAQLYGPEMIDKFGGFNIVDPGLLPIGMVSLFRSGRVKWQG